ncbi:serine--pyruvate aminotransferase, mitochondrial-like isoform X2 [Trichoplusia ni]|uniref:Alanine--glyoxylate aminotransferase n=1 Tax=Trichoplusia ni TaxID=7111 RepID=A0A7E5WVZ5_TRINI|nr:serine--pyruvate aminotransferase, mitochondrial-like isoform X2 [Trichoplusia ni]
MSAKTVPPPLILDRKFVVPLLCGPGPCAYWPSVTEALAKPVITPNCDEFYNVLDDIRAGLQYVFQTKSKLVLAMSGAGHSGMEAVISNLVAPGETLLVASRGMWDQRAIIIANRLGIKTEITSVPSNTTFSMEQLESELKRTRPEAMFITFGDSSTGTIQNIERLGDICHKYGALLLVDTVVSLIGVEFLMDEWGVDAVFSATQKAFSGPAGIAPVAFSALAEEKINNRKHEPSFYIDIKLLANQWNCYGDTRTYHHTLCPPMLWALRCCLQEIVKETLPVSWARHASSTAYFHQRLQEYSIELFVPKPEERLNTVTTVMLPEGYNHLEFHNYMREKHNILVLEGRGPTLGKAIRVGIMGVNATKEVADKVADALADSIQALRK